MVSPTSDQKPVVFVKNGEVYANSRDVAAFFEKRHDNVIRDIDNLLKSLAPQNWGAHFQEVTAFHDGANREVRYFTMTRNGFILLAMGFTGPLALQWKIRYLEAFNLMEAELKKQAAMQIPSHPEALRGWADAIEEKTKLEAQVAKMQPSVDAQKRLESATGALGLREAAYRLKINSKDLGEYLVEWKLCYRDSGRRLRPYGKYTIDRDGVTSGNLGYFDLRGVQILTEGGVSREKTTLVITPKGLGVIAKKLGKRLDDNQELLPV